MSKFIMLQPVGGNPFLLRVKDIHAVEMVVGKANGRTASRVTAVDAGGKRDYLTVAHTIDEIQAAIEGEIELVPRQPVQQPKRDDGEFRI